MVSPVLEAVDVVIEILVLARRPACPAAGPQLRSDGAKCVKGAD